MRSLNGVVISLLIGFALGTLFGQWYAHESFRSHWKHPGMRQRMREHMVEKMSKKLNLTKDQKARMTEIFEAKRPQMLALQAETRPKFEALRKSTQAEIRKILNSDQQKKFDEMHAKMEERWKEYTMV